MWDARTSRVLWIGRASVVLPVLTPVCMLTCLVEELALCPTHMRAVGLVNPHRILYPTQVIAHNGKCADRLMSTADAPAVHALLRTKFTPSATPQQV
jgi:hypothetical protein